MRDIFFDNCNPFISIFIFKVKYFYNAHLRKVGIGFYIEAGLFRGTS